MSNIFGIFNSGISGLMASQAGIDVTGHNIANVNTNGYSRQVVSLTTQTPNISGAQVYGRGVQVTSISRVYDEILAESIRNNQSQLSYYSSVQTTLSVTISQHGKTSLKHQQIRLPKPWRTESLWWK